MIAPDIEVILDVRDWPENLQEPKQFDEFWTMVEGALKGRDMAGRPVHTLGHPRGDVHIRVVRVRPGASAVVTDATTFHVAGVVESPRVQYRCGPCAARGDVRYGPFLCRSCPEDGDQRLCDEHVRFIDGALIATCDRHLPACEECGAAAVFRCPGSRCRHRKAYCAQHRVAHPNDHDLGYCAPCYRIRFPACEEAGCPKVGKIRCEMSDERSQQCGAQACALHARRWQVFGGERLGLGVCGRHAPLIGRMAADELIRQIVLGTFHRSHRRDAEPLPSLRGFAFNLRKNPAFEQLALDFRWIYGTLDRMTVRVEPAATFLANRRDGGRRSWTAEFEEISRGKGRGEELVAQLRIMVRQIVAYDGEALAQALRLADFTPSRTIRDEVRPALLFVHVPEHLRGAFKGRNRSHLDQFTARLSQMEPGGVTVRIEGDRPRGARR
jgi:hypothetical protein